MTGDDVPPLLVRYKFRINPSHYQNQGNNFSRAYESHILFDTHIQVCGHSNLSEAFRRYMYVLPCALSCSARSETPPAGRGLMFMAGVTQFRHNKPTNFCHKC